MVLFWWEVHWRLWSVSVCVWSLAFTYLDYRIWALQPDSAACSQDLFAVTHDWRIMEVRIKHLWHWWTRFEVSILNLTKKSVSYVCGSFCKIKKMLTVNNSPNMEPVTVSDICFYLSNHNQRETLLMFVFWFCFFFFDKLFFPHLEKKTVLSLCEVKECPLVL